MNLSILADKKVYLPLLAAACLGASFGLGRVSKHCPEPVNVDAQSHEEAHEQKQTQTHVDEKVSDQKVADTSKVVIHHRKKVTITKPDGSTKTTETDDSQLAQQDHHTEIKYVDRVVNQTQYVDRVVTKTETVHVQAALPTMSAGLLVGFDPTKISLKDSVAATGPLMVGAQLEHEIFKVPFTDRAHAWVGIWGVTNGHDGIVGLSLKVQE